MVLHDIQTAERALELLGIEVKRTCSCGALMLSSTRTGKERGFPAIESITYLGLMSFAGPTIMQTISLHSHADDDRLPWEIFLRSVAIVMSCQSGNNSDCCSLGPFDLDN